MRVVQFHRKSCARTFSIERLFEDIRLEMSRDIVVEVSMSRFASQGVLRRLYDVFLAVAKQGDVNHITGDVHFLTYFLNRRKTILTIHDCVTLERLNGIRYWIYWFFWYWLPIRRSKVITVISESTKKELHSHINISNCHIEIIPNCVSPEFEPHQKKFNSKCPRILQIGTKKNKNIERVAIALEGLPYCLVVIGKLTVEQICILKKYGVDVENHVGINRDELVKQYQQADLVMFASLYEGFGLPIVEAQAIGRPIITSNLYSMPEVGGHGACYVDPYDVSEIRSTVKKLIDDSEYRQRIIEHGYQNVTRFSAEVVARQYTDLYHKLYNALL